MQTIKTELDRNLIKTIESSQVVIIAGKRGSGKSGLLYSILENSQKENSYIMGIAKEYYHLLPDSIKPLPVSINTLNNLPAHATIGIDESGWLFPSRESFKPMNKLISKLLMNARKNDQFLSFATHTMRAFDVSVVLNSDALLFKEPSILHSKLERAEILKMVQEAKQAFNKIEIVERVKHTYIVSQDYEGMVEVPLPSFWCDDLSNAVAPEVFTEETPVPVIVGRAGIGERVLYAYQCPKCYIMMGPDKAEELNFICYRCSVPLNGVFYDKEIE